MLREIIINSTPFEKRIAILEEGKLVELIIENAEHQKILANIYKGRIQTVLPGLQSAFVDIGLAKSAFLHISHINTSDSVPIESRPHRSYKGGTKKMRIQDILKEGQEILVQIVKEPISTKGAKVTTSLSLPGRFLVLLSDSNFVRVSKKIHNRAQRNMLKRLIYEIKPSNIGFIVRTIGQHVSEEEFRIEIRKLLKKWNDIQKLAAKSKAPTLVYKDEEPALGIIRDLFSDDVHSVVMDSPSDYKAIHDYLKNLSPELLSKVNLYKEKNPIFDVYGIEEDIEKSFKRKIWIKGGSYILFDETEALTVIDVNTGRNVGGRDFESTILRTNLAAAREIAKQLRLRDVGGIIVIDFIDMERDENKKLVEDELKLHLKNDRTVFNIGTISEFGLLEMTRKRVRMEVMRITSDICDKCRGSGRITSTTSVLAKIGRALRKISALLDQMRLCLVVGPHIHDLLTENKMKKLKDLEKNNSLQIKLLEDPGMFHDEYRILDEKGEHDLTDVSPEE